MIGSQDFWRELPLFLSFPAQFIFVLIYAVPALGAGMWWKDFVGRALFVKSLSLAFVLGVSMLRNILEIIHHPDISFVWDQPIGELIVTMGFWLVMVAIYYQLVAIIKLRFGKT